MAHLSLLELSAGEPGVTLAGVRWEGVLAGLMAV